MITDIEFTVYRKEVELKIDEADISASLTFGLEAFFEALRGIEDDPDMQDLARHIVENRAEFEWVGKDDEHSVFKNEAEYNDWMEKLKAVME